MKSLIILLVALTACVAGQFYFNVTLPTITRTYPTFYQNISFDDLYNDLYDIINSNSNIKIKNLFNATFNAFLLLVIIITCCNHCNKPNVYTRPVVDNALDAQDYEDEDNE